MRDFTSQIAKAVLLCILSVSVFSCSEDEPLPETAMEFAVVDEIGNPVNGAVVKVYSDFDGYVDEDSGKLVGSAQTSAEGKAIVMGGLEAKQYYFSIKHTSSSIKNNWEGANTIQQPLTANKLNTVSVVLKDNAVGYLAGDGKKWKVHQVFYNDVDATSEFESCWLDNTYTFYKDKTILFSEGNTKCASSDSQEYWGIYKIEGALLTTLDDVDGQVSAYITELTGGTLTLAQQDAQGNVLEMTYKIVK